MKPVSFCKNLADKTIIDSLMSEKVNYKGLNLIINPQIGAWAVLDDKTMPVYNSLKNGISYSDLKSEIKDFPLLLKTLDNLFFSAIINIDGKNVFSRKQRIDTCAVNPKVIVVKYTKGCNLKCEYCYDFTGISHEQIPSEYIDKMLRLIQNAYGKDNITIIFHGGEPLLRFKDLKKEIEALKAINDTVDFSLQTNATLITKEIAEYIVKEKINVGVSLDGVTAESNKSRLLKNNRDSSALTLNGIDNLIEAGYDDIDLLAVITKNNYKDILNLIKSSKAKGIRSFNLNDYFPAGRGKGKEDKLALSTAENLKMKKELLLFINDYNEGKENQEKIYERQLYHLISLLANWNSSYMCAQSPCGAARRILALDTDGTIYPCDEFISENKKFAIGNINEINDINKTMINSLVVKRCLGHNIENIKECSACMWRKICPSHCAGNSYFFKGELNHTSSKCSFYKKFIPLAIELLYQKRIKVENIVFSKY